MVASRIFLACLCLGCAATAAAQGNYPQYAYPAAGAGPENMPPPGAMPYGPPLAAGGPAPAPYIQSYPNMQSYPSTAAAPNYELPHPAAAEMPAPEEKLGQSSWYSKIEYFHWNERIGGVDFVNESGPLTTVGYSHRSGIERFRIELFGGDMNYKGYVDDGNGGTDTIPSKTRYFGVRGEYELVLSPPIWEECEFIAGLGSRSWVRDIESGVSAENYFYSGYQEAWWSIYPYVGIESARHMSGSVELYASGRLGMTAFNYNYSAILDEPLWPRPGFFGQVELGLRGQRFYLSGYCEYMTFGRSRDLLIYDAASPGGFDTAFQPASQMVTVGGKLGLTF